jgi:hypothetical protein
MKNSLTLSEEYKEQLLKMSSIGTGYDLSASQFSPDGRVFQVIYFAAMRKSCAGEIS